MVKSGDIEFLNQLVQSLEKGAEKLEFAYNNQSAENFNKIKKFIIEVHGKILEVVNEGKK